MDEPDYKHADWLLFTQEKLIQKVCKNSVSISYYVKPNGTKNMRVNGITDLDISRLMFLTNTDQNNNFMYLDGFNVYINNGIIPIQVPGLEEAVINLFRNSDLNSFIELTNSTKTHMPFSIENIMDSNNNFDGNKTFNDYVDQFTAMLPCGPNTTGVPRLYELLICPDKGPAN